MKQTRALLLPLILLGLAGLACNFVTGGEESGGEVSTAVVEALTLPTATPEPAEPTEAPGEPTPAVEVLPPATDTPAPVEPAGPESPSLADAPYVDAAGHFTLVPPAGWIQEEAFGGASFNAPDDSGFVN
ncbi:MAG: hypothetical protein ABFS30_15285, partial [Pseudomonadota bacterium]